MARTARDVLNELRWRKGRDLARVRIWVADRRELAGGRILVGTEVVKVEHRYFSTAHATIPLYKILKITYNDRILFERHEPRRAS